MTVLLFQTKSGNPPVNLTFCAFGKWRFWTGTHEGNPEIWPFSYRNVHQKIKKKYFSFFPDDVLYENGQPIQIPQMKSASFDSATYRERGDFSALTVLLFTTKTWKQHTQLRFWGFWKWRPWTRAHEPNTQIWPFFNQKNFGSKNLIVNLIVPY